MPYKDPEKQREFKHEWYMKNKKLTNARTKKSMKKSIARNRKFIRQMKADTPCTDCKKSYPWYIMDFDHLRDKKYSLRLMVQHGYSLNTIRKEIEKCEIVCSNCHRARTHQRRIALSPVPKQSK